MNATHGTRHAFFLYLPPHLTPSTISRTPTFACKDKTVFQRVHKVLRLRAGDAVQFFTGAHSFTVTLTSSLASKNEVTGTITEVVNTEPRAHCLTAAISLLKKDAMEAAVYNAAQMGAETITPILTAKSRQEYMNSREEERLHSMIIAACEQSKNPHIPKLAPPRTLESLITQQKRATIVCFDATGTPLPELVRTLNESSSVKTCVVIGPEGGFVPEELTALIDAGAHVSRLTSTILRSRDAVCVGLGVVSSAVL